jgi:carboxymethylenebutenolidase
MEIHATRNVFQSGGKSIGVESFLPTAAGAATALIVIHGAAGIEYGNGYIRQLASAFAANQLSTHLVHYFDRTGNYYADDPTIHANFEKWLDTIGDAVAYVKSQPATDAKRIALFGYSLGGYLAVAEGARNSSVGAVIELAGGIDPSYAARAKRMPPTLILHGDQDRRVLPARAKELEELLQRLGTRHEMHIYPGEGHFLSPSAALDALARGMDFLERVFQTAG